MQERAIQVVMWLAGIGIVLTCAQPARAQSLRTDTPGAQVLERILVKVNGDLVSQSDLETAQINSIRTRPVPPQTDAELRAMVQEVTPELIANAVDELLLVQQGRELGYALDDEQFEDILEGIKEENGLDDEQLLVALERDEGMTLDELRETMERQMLSGQVQQVEILGRVSMTDTEARQYYDTNLEAFTEPASVTLREIVIAVPEGGGALNAGRENQAEAKAQAARARVLAGEDFAQVASEASEAPSSANGGLIGPIELADLAEAVRGRIEPLAVGEVSEVERTTAGYQILKLEVSTPPTPTPFEAVREGIVNNVFDERRLLALDEYLTRLRNEAIIEWKDEGLQTLYEAFLVERAASRGGA
jgi:peptidyl-prolyl cis-trans isomerase SurA